MRFVGSARIISKVLGGEDVWVDSGEESSCFVVSLVGTFSRSTRFSCGDS